MFHQCFDTAGWVIWPVETRPRYDDDDVQWFKVHFKADWKPAWPLAAHNAKVKTDMPEKNEKQLGSVESVQWVER